MTRSIRSLALLLLVLCAPIARAQEPAGERREALIQVFQDALQDGQWATAIAAGEQLQPIGPDDESLAYNLACAYARNGQTAQAVTWLGRAADSGFEAMKLVTTDPDLAIVRQAAANGAAPEYATALEKMKANRAASLREYQALAAKRPPLIFLPDGYDSTRGAPLIIALHGFGADAADIAGAWHEVASRAGAILAAPDAARPAPGGRGYQWLFADESEWRVLDTLAQVKERYNVDTTRVVLTGFSQGANLTLSAGLAHPDLFQGLIPMSGFYAPEEMPMPEAPSARARVFLMIGGADRGTNSFAEAKDSLASAGYPVALKTYPGLGHAFPPNSSEELSRALDFVLGR